MDWQEVPEDGGLWSDGDVLLVAVPLVSKTSDGKAVGWYYELSVITIECDEESFAVNIDGERWGWDMTDMDFCVKIK